MPIQETILAQIRANDPTLTALDLSDNDLRDSDIIELCSALEQNKTLKTLNLAKNVISEDGLASLSRITTLTTLDLSCDNENNSYDESELELISRIPNLKTLILKDIYPSEEGITWLMRHKTVSRLDLSDNLIDSYCAELLARKSNIQTLILKNCKIDGSAAEELYQSPTLTALDLSNNNIGRAGAALLALSPTLTALNLTGNDLGNVSKLFFLQNTRLLKLDLSDTYLEDDHDIQERIRTNRCNYVKALFNATVILLNKVDINSASLVLAYLLEGDTLGKRLVTHTSIELPVISIGLFNKKSHYASSGDKCANVEMLSSSSIS